MARRKGSRKGRPAIRSSAGSSPRSGSRPLSITRSVSSQVFQATLSGFEEVPPRLTGAGGRFWARLIDGGTALQYELRYADPTTPVTAAHIHFGQRGVNGEIMVFLCGGDDAPACPPRGGTVTGLITADDVRAIPEQGLQAGDFEGFIQILRAGVAYVNVHTTMFPAGEIRGQVE